MESSPKIAYYGTINPPYSDRVSPLRASSVGSRILTIIGFAIGALLVAGPVWFVGFLFGWTWLAYLGIGLGICMVLGLGWKASKAQISACPYCGADIGTHHTLNSDDRQKQLACDKRHEWLISDSGQVRAFREVNIGDKKEFDCPVFANGIWPAECIVCGAPATRRLNARTFGVGGAALLIGRISVSWGSVKDIPYCENHKDAVSIKTVDKKIWAVFNDYAMQRRYLHVNRLHFAAKAKG